MPPPSITVAVCCYNSARRLPDTLRRLAAQVVPEDIRWEVLVIDNASADGTADVALKVWPSDAPAPLRVVSEPKAGLSNARHRAIMEAQYDIIGFIDDDNWVCDDWIQTASRTMSSHPEAGACGGPSEPVFESSPPEWFPRFSACYAVGDQASAEGDVTETRGWLWGAGLCLRRKALLQLFSDGFTPLLSDRKGKQLTSGGDNELCYALIMAGWRVWYNPSLKLSHFLPKERLTSDYLKRWFAGAGASSVLAGIYENILGIDGGPANQDIVWYKLAYWQLVGLMRRIRKVRRQYGRAPIPLEDEVAILSGRAALIKYLSLSWQYPSHCRALRNASWVRRHTVQ